MKLTPLLSGLASLAFVTCASAQVPGLPNVTQLSARAGFFLPSSGGHGTWPAFGVDARVLGLNLPGVPLGASIFLSGDYYGKKGSQSIPIMANFGARFEQFTLSAGAGVGFDRVSGGSDRTESHFQIGAAYNFSGSSLPVFLEGKYHFSPKSELSGFALYVGVRF